MKKAEQPEYEATIKFDRNNGTYRPEEVVSGSIVFQRFDGHDFKLDVNSVGIKVFGGLTVHNKSSSKALEAIMGKLEKVKFIELAMPDLAKNKTLTSKDKIPFKFKLEQKEHKMLQTYTGIFINIAYIVTIETKMFNGQPLTNEVPLFVQVAQAGRQAIEGPYIFPKVKYFMITNEQIVGDVNKIPKFKVKGEITSEICQFADDFNGFLVVDHADTPIRQIDLQMLRVQRIQTPTGKFSEKTEIQLIQICHGNITRNLQIPIYMIFPRHFSCPSVKYQQYRVDFQVNLLVIFKDGFKVTVNLPLKIVRS